MKISNWIVLAMLPALAALLIGCDERTPVTATPSPEPPVVNTLAPTPTLALSPTATSAVAPLATPLASPTPGAGSPTPTQAQGVEQRISFTPGAISATVENAVVLGARDRYILEALAGQRMLLEASALEDNVEFQLLAPDGSELAPSQTVDGVPAYDLPQSGDYLIIVGATRGNATYRLRVTIPPLGSAQPTRINFEPGMTGAQATGSLQSGERALYVLEAAENQHLMAGVFGATAPLALGVQGADGTVFLPLGAAKTDLHIVALPATMDYFIEIAALGAATDFVLDVGASSLADLPQRLSLAPGDTESVTGLLQPGGDLDSYILALEAGQGLVVDALPPQAPLSVYLQSEDGELFFFAVDGRLEVTAPRTLDYVLTVSTPNAAGETAYELRIALNSQ